MKTVTATLTSKGQVTIPVEVRHLLGLHSGDHLLFRIDETADEPVSTEISGDNGDCAGVAERLPDLLDLAGALPAPLDRQGDDWKTIRETAWAEELRSRR